MNNCQRRADDEHRLIARYVETLSSANGPQAQVSIFRNRDYQFGLRLAVTSYRRRHHGDASSASL